MTEVLKREEDEQSLGTDPKPEETPILDALAKGGVEVPGEIPTMITRDMEDSLLARHFSQEEIEQMTPERAQKLIGDYNKADAERAKKAQAKTEEQNITNAEPEAEKPIIPVEDAKEEVAPEATPELSRTEVDRLLAEVQKNGEALKNEQADPLSALEELIRNHGAPVAENVADVQPSPEEPIIKPIDLGTLREKAYAEVPPLSSEAVEDDASNFMAGAKLGKAAEKKVEVPAEEKRKEPIDESEPAPEFKKALDEVVEQPAKKTEKPEAPKKINIEVGNIGVGKFEGLNAEGGNLGTVEGVNFPGIEKTPKEKAFEILNDREKNGQTQKELAEAFENLTGEKLEAKRDELVDKNLKERNVTVIHREQMEAHRQKLIAKEQEKISAENHSRAMETLWARNPKVKPEDREKFLASIWKKVGVLGIGNDIENPILDKLINEGYRIENIKKGWFGKVKIPRTNGFGVLAYDSKEDFIEQTLREAKLKISDEAQVRANSIIVEGRKRLVAERAACTDSIIGQAVEKYGSEKLFRQEAENESQSKTERESNESYENKTKYKKTENYFRTYLDFSSIQLEHAEATGDAWGVDYFGKAVESSKSVLSSLEGGDVAPATKKLLDIIREHMKGIEYTQVMGPQKEISRFTRIIAELVGFVSELNGAESAQKSEEAPEDEKTATPEKKKKKKKSVEVAKKGKKRAAKPEKKVGKKKVVKNTPKKKKRK